MTTGYAGGLGRLEHTEAVATDTVASEGLVCVRCARVSVVVVVCTRVSCVCVCHVCSSRSSSSG